MSTYASGPQGGVGLHSPRYHRYERSVTFTPTQLNTGNASTFSRVVGPQTIILTTQSTPPVYCSFSLKGGSNTSSLDLVPSYPNTSPYYPTTINYTPEGTPRGCTVEGRDPSANSLRLNVFRINNYNTGFYYDLAFSPFTDILPTLTFPSPQVATDNLTLTLIYYRLTPNLRSEYPSSFGAPEYFRQEFGTLFASNAGVNPLDDLQPHTFYRFNGQQELQVVNPATGDYFSFEMDAGILDNAGGYVGLTDPSANARVLGYLQNCSIEYVDSSSPAINRPFVFRVTNTSDGRVYQFTFYFDGYRQTLPTIQLYSGAALGAESLGLISVTQTFRTI